MTEQHDLDDLVPAGIDDCVEHELRQLFAVARAPGATDELTAEASVVAAMSDIVHRQTAVGHVTQRRTPLRRIVGSRTAKVATITGFVVVLTSAAAAAGVVPQPVQSVFDRAARIANWRDSDRDDAAAAVPDDPEPTTITKTTEAPNAIGHTTVPPSVAVDQETDAQALCVRWAASIRAGVELEAEAKRTLIAMSASAGAAVERLCGQFVPTPSAALPTAQESPPPGAMLPPAVSTVDATPVPAAEAPPASTDDGTPKATPTLPPRANGNGPPVREPSPVDETNNGTPSANANANATGNANAHGGNPNANSNAGGANANGNGNGNGAGANGSASNENSNGGNGND